jgi:hypothetical protein
MTLRKMSIIKKDGEMLLGLWSDKAYDLLLDLITARFCDSYLGPDKPVRHRPFVIDSTSVPMWRTDDGQIVVYVMQAHYENGKFAYYKGVSSESIDEAKKYIANVMTKFAANHLHELGGATKEDVLLLAALVAGRSVKRFPQGKAIEMKGQPLNAFEIERKRILSEERARLNEEKEKEIGKIKEKYYHDLMVKINAVEDAYKAKLDALK